MNLLQALILGCIQGLTEFFPVSSSGHLKLAEHLLGMKHLDKLIFFDLICHLGTLGSTLIIFQKDILNLFKDKEFKLIKLLFVALIPLFPLAVFEKKIHWFFDSPTLLPLFFLLSASLLFFADRIKQNSFTLNSLPTGKKAYIHSFSIGFFQAMAILPGISRSGATFCCARFLHWSPDSALRFSFLLSLPTIGGGLVLKVLKLVHHQEPFVELPLSCYLVASLSSFFVGLFALKILIKIISRDRLKVFIVYLTLLSILTFFII